MATKMTRQILEAYLNCKTKAHLKLAGQQGIVSDYQALLVANRQAVRRQAIEKILARNPETEVARDISLTAAALGKGPSFVLNATLEDDLLSLSFDGLKRVDGPSKLGDFQYVPMLFHEGQKVGKKQRLLLEIYGLLLSPALSQKSSTSLGVLDAAWLFQMRRLSPHAVVGYGHRVMRRRALDGVAMAACIARRLDHRLGRDARRPPASAVRATLHRAALRPRSPHRHQLAARLRHGARLQTLLLPARQRGTQDPSDRQSLAPHPPQATPRRWCGYAVGLRHRRLPHQAVRAARRGRWQASQPDPRAGRVQVPLRPRLGLSGPAGPTSALGAIALPIVSHLYIRAKDVGWMAAYYGWQFHTKLELAAAQIEWLVQQLGPNRPPIWVVTDGAYAKRPFLKRVLAAGVTVISRLRCDAALWSLPVVVDPGQKRGRGRPPKYGKNRIDLAKRAAQTRGWQTGLFSLYGRLVVKKYKTFLATYKPVGGVIRVVLVREPDRWVAYFSTDPDLSVASILETVADRSALEQVFHDVKEVHGAGQQQLRHVWANVGAWNLIGWWHTLVELWAWDRPQSRLRDRSDSPWDKPERRPSHANRCQELRREALQEEYSSLPSVAGLRPKIRRFIQRLMRRVA